MEVLTKTQSYLTFRLVEETFAASVSSVIEILELTRVTKVPRAPHFMRGVINLRGSVLPVIDTRRKFGLEETEDTVHTCIMVLSVRAGEKNIFIGALVDAVQEVLEIEPERVQAPPAMSVTEKDGFITGMVKMEDHFVMVLDTDKVFSSEEVILLHEAARQN